MFFAKRLLLSYCFTVAGLTAMSESPLIKQPNPVALSIGLFNQATPKEVEEYGKYYHLDEISLSDKECVFSTDNGGQMSFAFGNDMEKQVVLNTKLPKKEIVKLLEECQFEKVKTVPAKYKGMNVYEKKGSSFSPVRTICVFGNTTPFILTFLKDKK